jgi:hypothetical protein
MVAGRLLIGNGRLITELLRQLPSSRPLADALLTTAAPSELCGAGAVDAAAESLSALRSAASNKVWREWVKRWSEDPMLASFLQNERPWWRRWKS